MDIKLFVKTLRKALLENNNNKKFSEAWLTEEDAGGLYNTGKYNLHLKADFKIDSLFAEIREVIHMLGRDAPEASKLIWTVRIYNSSDRVRCEIFDICVFSETMSFRYI